MESLKGEWAELWTRCSGATPFQSPQWLLPWWKHLGQGDLWVLALRQEDRLVGVAPFFIQSLPESGARQVLLLGSGITDYLDVLLEAEFESLARAAILAHLDQHRERWNLCDFQQLRGCSQLLEVGIAPDWDSVVNVQEVCPVLGLPPEIEQLPRSVPTHMLDKLWYYRRRVRKLAAARIESANPENFDELFERLLQLHRARWASRGQNGVLAEEQVQQFHREAAYQMLVAGTLRLYGLRVGERIEASFYGFGNGQRTFYYLGGFEPELSPYSPGALLIGHAIEEAIREGAAEFDFLRGREAYKYMWGAKGRLNYRRQLWHSAASERARAA
ncbi:MAG TPA: GNAT family N-acetyltransferase [Bacillota bacterium]|nr:GNAT family N-acetyltransferase [Bacillota bacterium]